MPTLWNDAPLSCSLVAKYQNSFKEELKLHLRQRINRGRRVTKKGRLDKHEGGVAGEKETGGVVRLSIEQPDRLVFEGTRWGGAVGEQNSPYSYPY